MGVGLQPLEFTECLADSPAFRDNLQRHEKELERTSQQIKRLIKEVKDVVNAARRLGAAQLALASSMEQFEFAVIGASQTEDERVIGRSLAHFATLIRTIEDERDRMLGRAHDQIIQPLERFRKEHIGAVKEGKKKFDKKTAKFCASQERTLSLSARKQDAVFQEADAAMEMASRDFCGASLEYVCRLQALQERQKFELVEPLLGFVCGWGTFHHAAHDAHHDTRPVVQDLQLSIQRTRSNFEETSKQTESLMKKMMELRQVNKEEEGEEGQRAGYLFLMEKKAWGTTWSKQYGRYRRGAGSAGGTPTLSLQPYSQLAPRACGAADVVPVVGARAASEGERRFVWEAVPRDADRAPLTLQSLSEADRAAWMRALQPAPAASGGAAGAGPEPAPADPEGESALDAQGIEFCRLLVGEIEARGLQEPGLYRVAGVASKVSSLVSVARAPPPLCDALRWETRTLTSALKAFLRALPEPLLTHRLRPALLDAAKCERVSDRVSSLRSLLRALPPRHYHVLQMIIAHLTRVASCSAVNLMSAGNLAVCWGPTLLRPQASVASILELKFHNVVVETLIDHYHQLFDQDATANGAVGASPVSDMAALPGIERLSVSCVNAGGAGGTGPHGGARYSPQHAQLLTQLSPPHAPRAPAHAHAHTLHALLYHRGSHSGSNESVSSPSASPPAPSPSVRGCQRVRTLYACLGEGEGELSFEPNQIITNVAPSLEPGWLRGTLNGRQGLVPVNYVEPLP